MTFITSKQVHWYRSTVVRLHRMHEMQPILTDDREVCYADQLAFAVQKRLNESRCRLV